MTDDARAVSLRSVCARNVTRLLRAASVQGAFLGFTASSCAHCADHETQWAAYAAMAAASPAAALPAIFRVDSDVERSLVRRHEVVEVPALVLAWHDRFTPYIGPHTSAAMLAFASAQLEPPAVRLKGERELKQLLANQEGSSSAGAVPGAARSASDTDDADNESAPALEPILLLGFFTDLDDEEDEVRVPLPHALHPPPPHPPLPRPSAMCLVWPCAQVEDFVQAAVQLRKLRTDVPVRAAYVQLTASLSATFGRSRQWFTRGPCAVLLAGGRRRHAAASTFQLDETHEGGLSLAEWAMRTALPAVGELSPTSFAAYAATSLPMLIAFVLPRAAKAAGGYGHPLTLQTDARARTPRNAALSLSPSPSQKRSSSQKRSPIPNPGTSWPRRFGASRRGSAASCSSSRVTDARSARA